MFLSLFIIFFFGIVGGLIFEKIKLPRLVFYIILGILIGPSVFNIVDQKLLDISSILRQIALVLILTRSGLSLDFKVLKQIGRPAILMCFIPAIFEIIGILIFGPILFDISILEALLLGSVLAAVSPAIVVPRMIHLKEKGYGNKHHVPEVILAGASCDDIFVIILFYAFKNLVSVSTIDVTTFIEIPLRILLGIGVGCGIGFIFSWIIERVRLTLPIQIILLLSISFGLLALESYIPISALLSIIVIGILIRLRKKDSAIEIQKGYNSLWSGFEILLFVLVGCATDVRLAFSKEGGILLGLIILALVFRCIGVLLCVVATKYSKKEKLYIVISYLPKATVQASIGGIALAEGLSCGPLVLTAAVISILFTAPLGAILMDYLYPRLLDREADEKLMITDEA